MYVTRNEYMVTAGRYDQYEARNSKFFELLRAQPGYQAGFLLQSLGSPAKYTRLGRCESREAQMAFTKSDKIRTFQQANPNDGMWTPSGPQQAFEVLVIVDGAWEAKYANIVDWNIKPGMAAAFESNRKALFELRKQHLSGKGWVSSRLARFLGTANKYFILNLDSGPEFAGDADVPEIQLFNLRSPGADFRSTPNVQERYEVIQRV
ncbi:MAG: hypothetical protein EXR50_05865 [Dehalococcoidia bacterium]|nr:hypothetical protein [Dehalococcoidia bacterium]